MKTRFLPILAAIGLATNANAANILITKFDFDNSRAPYTTMKATLEAAGHTATIVDARTGGSLAAALGAASYDQVYLWDLSENLYLNATDTAALGSFWSSHRGLVVDSRSYGYYFQGTDPSEQALLRNVAANFGLTGGGVWVGTDHNPNWTNNGNAFLTAIGVNPITGSYGDPVNFADPSSVLLSGVTPTALWGGGETVGSVPLGVQPNGVEMFLHFGHIRADQSILPYISASFPLSGPQPPSGVPDGGSTALMLVGALVALVGARRAQR
jgi:hypothetical protein